MQLHPDDVHSFASPPLVGETVLLVFEDLKVLPVLRSALGWRCALTGALPLGEPIGWTDLGPPLIEPTLAQWAAKDLAARWIA